MDRGTCCLIPANINDMKDRITAAINKVDRNMLRRVWDKFSNWLDFDHAARGDHIKQL